MVLSPLLGLAGRQPQRRWAAGQSQGLPLVRPQQAWDHRTSQQCLFPSPPTAETNHDFLSLSFLTQVAVLHYEDQQFGGTLWDQ